MDSKGRNLSKDVTDVLDRLVELEIINYSKHDKMYFYRLPDGKNILVLDYFFQKGYKDLPKNVSKHGDFRSQN